MPKCRPRDCATVPPLIIFLPHHIGTCGELEKRGKAGDIAGMRN